MPSRRDLGTVTMAIVTSSTEQHACVTRGLNADRGQRRLLEEVTFKQKPKGRVGIRQRLGEERDQHVGKP